MRSLNRSMRIGLNGGIRVLMCTVDRVYCHGNKKVHGKSGSIHYPRIVLPGKDVIYHREVGQVEYQSKDGTQTKVDIWTPFLYVEDLA